MNENSGATAMSLVRKKIWRENIVTRRTGKGSLSKHSLLETDANYEKACDNLRQFRWIIVAMVVWYYFWFCSPVTFRSPGMGFRASGVATGFVVRVEGKGGLMRVFFYWWEGWTVCASLLSGFIWPGLVVSTAFLDILSVSEILLSYSGACHVHQRLLIL